MNGLLRSIRDQRGTVIVYTLMTILGVLVVTGIATDIGRALATKRELQKSFDAGTLAGVADLVPFDTSTYNGAGTAGKTWAEKNDYAGGATTVAWNVGNTGNVQIGVWNTSSKTWTTSLTPVTSGGTTIHPNAIRVQWAASVPTAFMHIIGKPTLNVSALSTAFRGCPSAPCPGCAVVPLGVPRCTFPNNMATGCGGLVTTNAPAGNATWVNLVPGATSAPSNTIGDQLDAAAGGSAPPSGLVAGVNLAANNGTLGGVYNDLGSNTQPNSPQHFPSRYNTSPDIVVRDASNNITYQGPGWKVVVPVLETGTGAACSSPTGNGPYSIATWTYLIIVQVINGGECTVNNPGYGGSAPWNAECAAGINGGTNATPSSSLNAVYGYYSCERINSPSISGSCPLTALGNPILVQ